MFEKKQGLSICIHLRSKLSKGEACLYGRLNYNGYRTTEYRLGIYVPIEAWNQKLKGLNPEHPLANALQIRIAEVKAEHESILLYQQTQQSDFVPTADTVRIQWAKKEPLGPSSTKLIEAYDYYLKYIDTLPKDESKSGKTIKNYRVIRNHLVCFLKQTGQLKILADAITPGWGRQFYDYLRSKMAKDTSARYVSAIRSALSHAIQYEIVKKNGLYEFVAPKSQARKPIYFLRKDHLEQLANLPLTGIRKQTRDWALFMCYTGLDYNDAKVVVANPDAYFVRGGGGDKWVYQRLKLKRVAMWGECHIPILEKAKAILPLLPTRKQPRLKVINTWLNEMGEAMQLPFAFSSKVCRKTAGVVFMEEGYSMQAIQKILGHQSLRMTELHYVSIQPSVVDKDTARIQSSVITSQQNPFTHIYNAS